MAETMKHTGSEMSRLDSSERFAVIAVMRGLFRVEVQPRRRWKWWGKRGWLVVLHLLHEQDHTWRCSKFITSFRELCTRLGIDQDEPVWQYWTQQPSAPPATPGRAEDSGWMPFWMF